MAKKSSGQGELIHHVNAVRMRVVGSGNLDMTLLGLDDINSVTLSPFVMQATRAIEPTRLSNFKGQRILLRLGVNEIDEWFRIHRIIIFARPVEADFPSILNT